MDILVFCFGNSKKIVILSLDDDYSIGEFNKILF